jgi:hypothetical protein
VGLWTFSISSFLLGPLSSWGSADRPALPIVVSAPCRAIEELKRRKLLTGGEQVAIVQSGRQPIWRSASTHNISVRKCPEDPEDSDE